MNTHPFKIFCVNKYRSKYLGNIMDLNGTWFPLPKKHSIPHEWYSFFISYVYTPTEAPYSPHMDLEIFSFLFYTDHLSVVPDFGADLLPPVIGGVYGINTIILLLLIESEPPQSWLLDIIHVYNSWSWRFWQNTHNSRWDRAAQKESPTRYFCAISCL